MKRLRLLWAVVLSVLTLQSSLRAVVLHHCCRTDAASTTVMAAGHDDCCDCCADHAFGASCCRETGHGTQFFQPGSQVKPAAPRLLPADGTFVQAMPAALLPAIRPQRVAVRPMPPPPPRTGRRLLALFATLLL